MPVRTVALAAALLLAPAARGQFQPLPAEQIKKIKAATVYIKMRAGSVEGSGSGFLVKADGQTGYVATNDHVIAGPRTPVGRVRAQVELVFFSGTRDEWAVPGEVVGRDSERDLALVRFRASKSMPEPMPLAPPDKDKLTETTPVYVCGFPFGDMLAAGNKNPEISISQGSVSSFRSNDRGELVTVQLTGALNPGNSGGPVVTADGRLVGVAVRTVKGAGIGEAVPGEMVGQMLKGRVGGVRLIQTREGAAARTAALMGQIADPFNKVRSPRGLVAPAGSGNGVPADVGAVPGAVKLPLRVADPAEMLVFSPVRLPGVRQVWVQVEWTADGVTKRSPAEKVDIKSAAQIAEEEEKIAAMLRQLFGQDSSRPPAEAEEGPNPIPGVRPPSGPPRRSPGPPSVPDGFNSRTGVRGVNGQPLPPLAIRPTRTDAGTQLGELMGRQQEFEQSGQELTLQVMAAKAEVDGYGDGPSLTALHPETNRPITWVDLVLDRRQADRFNALRLGVPLPVAVTGRLQPPAGIRPWKVFVVRQLHLLDVDGNPVEPSDRTDPPPAPPANLQQVWVPPYRAEGTGWDELRKVRNRTLRASGRLSGLGVSGGLRGVPNHGFSLSDPNGQRMSLSFQLFPALALATYNAANRLRATPGGPVQAEFDFQAVGVKRGTTDLVCSVTHVQLVRQDGNGVAWSCSGPPPDVDELLDISPANKPGGVQPAVNRSPDVAAGPAKAGTPPSADAQAGPSTVLLLLVGVLAVGGAAGAGVLVYVLARKSAAPAGRKRPRRRDDDFDDDDDWDDRPRKPARRR